LEDLRYSLEKVAAKFSFREREEEHTVITWIIVNRSLLDWTAGLGRRLRFSQPPAAGQASINSVSKWL
jgi:hypothetical protein